VELSEREEKYPKEMQTLLLGLRSDKRSGKLKYQVRLLHVIRISNCVPIVSTVSAAQAIRMENGTIPTALVVN
jgi:hypothetical protein